MAGRPPAFSYAQFKEAFAQSAAEGKEPTYEAVRARSPMLTADRPLSEDIESLDLVKIVGAAEKEIGELI